MRRAFTTSAILALLLAPSMLGISAAHAEPGNGPLIPLNLTPAPNAETPKNARLRSSEDERHRDRRETQELWESGKKKTKW